MKKQDDKKSGINSDEMKEFDDNNSNASDAIIKTDIDNGDNINNDTSKSIGGIANNKDTSNFARHKAC